MAAPDYLNIAHIAYASAYFNSTYIDGRLKRKITYFDRPGRLQNVSIGDLPAVEVIPIGGTDYWETNQWKKVEYQFRNRLCTREWSTVEGESLVLHMRASIFQEFDDTSPTSAFRIKEQSPFTIQFVTLGAGADGPAVTIWEWTDTVTVGRYNPRLYVQ